MRGIKLILCLVPLLSIVGAQGESKWSWSSNNRNSIADSSDRLIDRRKYESLEDLRDRYEVNEQTTRKPNGEDYYGNGNGNGNGNVNSNGRFGFNDPNSIAGNGYNSNSFGPFGPQGLGGPPNNFNYPLYGNQFNGPSFGYPNNYNKPGFNNNFYPNGGFPQNYGNGFPTNYYPGGYYPNRYPFNPLGNNAANGVLVGPGGPTGLYGRPSNYVGQNQLPFNGVGGPYNNGGFFGGAPFNGGFNGGVPFNGGPGGLFNGSPGFNGGFPNGPIPFNSKAGSGISAEEDDPKGREADKKSNE